MYLLQAICKSLIEATEVFVDTMRRHHPNARRGIIHAKLQRIRDVRNTNLGVGNAAITADDSGRRFWGYITTVPLTLLTLAGCVIAWNPATMRERWWLVAAAVMLAERVGTFGYFIPTLLKLMQAERLTRPETEQTARRWVRRNRIRCLLAFAGWLAALKALSL